MSDSAPSVSSMSVSASGRWIWYRSIQSVFSRRSEFSTSRTIQRRELPNSFGSSPIVPCTLVASTTLSRRPSASALPTISSDSPREYTSAVSMKLIPASSARWMMRIESLWSVLPQAPNIIAPRQSGLTCTPVRPRARISMAATVRGPMSLLLLKLTLAPGLVTATTLAGRRWGPRMAGWLGGLPVVVAPILLAITLEHGRSFGSRAAGGALLGLLSLTGFVLAYGWSARVMGWPYAAALGWLVFVGMTFLLDQIDPPNWASYVVVCTSFAFAAALL